jgi:aminoglycoside phosphotransferase
MTARPRKVRKVTPTNRTSQQYGEVNSSLLRNLKTAIDEDPLQDLTPLLEAQLRFYQQSLRTIRADYTQHNAPPVENKAETPHERSTDQADPLWDSRESIYPSTFPTLPQSRNGQRLLQRVNIFPSLKSYVRQPPNALVWNELFDLISQGEILWELYNRKVVKVAEKIVVKLGRGVHDFRDEVILMELVANFTSIPVPRVFGFHHNDNDECFVFMSYAEGCTLESVWNSLGTEGRDKIVSQLQGYFAELRSLPPPSPVIFGSIATGICRDARRHERQRRYIGSESQFNEFLGDFTLRRNSDHVRLLLSGLKEDHRIVLTHGDLHPRNIIVRGFEVTGIIDWELGGWYPEYWDYVKGLNHCRGCENWYQQLAYITGEYKYEWAMDHHLDYFIVNSPTRSLT